MQGFKKNPIKSCRVSVAVKILDIEIHSEKLKDAFYLIKMIPFEAIVEEVLFLRKTKAEFVLTNLKLCP